MFNLMKKFWSEDEGAAMVEYGLLAALIAVICIAAVTVIGTQLSTKFSTVAASVSS